MNVIIKQHYGMLGTDVEKTTVKNLEELKKIILELSACTVTIGHDKGEDYFLLSKNHNTFWD